MSFYDFSKRVVDIAGASTFLLATAPITAAVAIGVRLQMGSPVIFRHQRPGYREQIFDCLKFRTMTDARDADGHLLPDADRLTAFGQFLRRCSLDEFPQFWNVLRGEMSLVGPRPLEVRYLPRYSAEQRRRHSVKPGITGWGPNQWPQFYRLGNKIRTGSLVCRSSLPHSRPQNPLDHVLESHCRTRHFFQRTRHHARLHG